MESVLVCSSAEYGVINYVAILNNTIYTSHNFCRITQIKPEALLSLCDGSIIYTFMSGYILHDTGIMAHIQSTNSRILLG